MEFFFVGFRFRGDFKRMWGEFFVVSRGTLIFFGIGSGFLFYIF